MTASTRCSLSPMAALLPRPLGRRDPARPKTAAMATPSTVSPIALLEARAGRVRVGGEEERKTRNVVNAGVTYQRLGCVPAAAATRRRGWPRRRRRRAGPRPRARPRRARRRGRRRPRPAVRSRCISAAGPHHEQRGGDGPADVVEVEQEADRGGGRPGRAEAHAVGERRRRAAGGPRRPRPGRWTLRPGERDQPGPERRRRGSRPRPRPPRPRRSSGRSPPWAARASSRARRAATGRRARPSPPRARDRRHGDHRHGREHAAHDHAGADERGEQRARGPVGAGAARPRRWRPAARRRPRRPPRGRRRARATPAGNAATAATLAAVPSHASPAAPPTWGGSLRRRRRPAGSPASDT